MSTPKSPFTNKAELLNGDDAKHGDANQPHEHSAGPMLQTVSKEPVGRRRKAQHNCRLAALIVRGMSCPRGSVSEGVRGGTWPTTTRVAILQLTR